ncbi:MAG TPA: response regulator, partial [Symbiobacteriaceae bacterium]|nr:response regulator [Symbiobacteriaceae bacterium]
MYRFIAGVAAVCLLPVVVLLISTGLLPEGGGLRYLNVLTLLCAVLPAMALLWAAIRHQGARRRYWGWWAAGGLAWLTGESVWTVYALADGVALPFPSWADPPYLAFYPLVLGATLHLFPRGSRAFDRLRLIGDISAALLAALALMWTPVIVPILRSSEMTMLGQILSMAYPAGDLLLMVAMLLPIPIPATSRRWQIAGLACFLAADVAFAVLTNAGTYNISNWIDPLWYIAMTCIVIGAFADDGRPVPQPKASSPNQALRVLGPYVALAGAVAAGLVLSLKGVPAGTVGLLVGFGLPFAAIGVMQQWAYLSENQRLQQTLEQRVAERTAELELRIRQLGGAPVQAQIAAARENTRPVVLCVDGDRPTQELLRRFLEPEGYVVETAVTAAAGLSQAMQTRPDLVVLDVQLPDASGWTLLREIRR